MPTRTGRWYVSLIVLFLCMFLVPIIAQEGARSSGGTGGSPTGGMLMVGDTESTFVRIPNKYDPSKPAPMIIVLHGTIDIGNVYFNMYSDLAEKETEEPWNRAIIVAPQSPGDNWHDAKYSAEVNAYLDGVRQEMCRKYNVDLGRIVIAGWSTGAVFIGGYVMRRPGTFMAAVMQEGGGYWGAPLQRTKHHPTAHRFVIGDQDFMMPQTRRHFQRLQEAGYPVSVVVGPGLEHGAAVFLEGRETWDWIKRQPPVR
ncbi:MAG: hypothetical protein JXA20_08385 [Spirochaetes bacterium]|nr:hypothetical protein [Spirochaetota bacterium]